MKISRVRVAAINKSYGHITCSWWESVIIDFMIWRGHSNIRRLTKEQRGGVWKARFRIFSPRAKPAPPLRAHAAMLDTRAREEMLKKVRISADISGLAKAAAECGRSLETFEFSMLRAGPSFAPLVLEAISRATAFGANGELNYWAPGRFPRHRYVYFCEALVGAWCRFDDNRSEFERVLDQCLDEAEENLRLEFQRTEKTSRVQWGAI